MQNTKYKSNLRFVVRVKPGSRRNVVCKNAQKNEFIVETTSRPKDGEANETVILLLARYFKLPKSMVAIIRGHRSRVKIVRVSQEKFS